MILHGAFLVYIEVKFYPIDGQHLNQHTKDIITIKQATLSFTKNYAILETSTTTLFHVYTVNDLTC